MQRIVKAQGNANEFDFTGNADHCLSEAVFRIAMDMPYKMLEYLWHGFNLDWASPRSETQGYHQKLKWDQNKVSNKNFLISRRDLTH